MTRVFPSLLAWLVVLALVAPASAQEAQPTNPEPSEEPSEEPPSDGAEAEAPPEYDALVAEAVSEAQEARWEEARALFRRAHAVFPNARTYRGIGIAAYQVQDYPDAVRSFRAALDDPRRPLTDAMRAEATRQLEHALSFVGRYTLDEAPDGARIVVDGIAVTPDEEGVVIMATGPHTVEVLADGHRWEGRWRVRGGEDAPIPIVFDRPEETPAAVAPPPDAPAPPAPFDPVPPAVLTASGALLFLVGAVLVVAGFVDFAAVEGAARGTEWDDVQGALDRAPILTGTGFVLAGVGAALGVSGAVWWATGDEQPTPTAMLTLRGAL